MATPEELKLQPYQRIQAVRNEARRLLRAGRLTEERLEDVITQAVAVAIDGALDTAFRMLRPMPEERT